MRALEEGLNLLAQKGAGVGHQDQVALLLELGRAKSHQAQFQQAVAALNAAKRFLEHEGARGRLVGVLQALGQAHMGLGQLDAAYQYFNEALGLARILDDAELKASCHLDLGILRASQQIMGPAQAHLVLAAMGDFVQADFLLLKVSELPTQLATALEQGDTVFLGAEVAMARESWRDAKRLYLEAANRFGEAGLVWRERLARLRCTQAAIFDAEDPGSAWTHLERLKGPVEASGSRWLELEWHRAHGLLLSRAGADRVSEALLAWGEVAALARDLKFHARVLEAGTRGSELLRAGGEKLGARSRIQDALASFQELWSRLPPPFEETFLGRPDIHAFRQAVEGAGMPFTLPAKVDPLADWSPTQANLPVAPNPRVNP
jgi:tetratricopeptide (TPR) repeat protein